MKTPARRPDFVIRLAVLGFTAEFPVFLQYVAAALRSEVSWELAELEDADAVMINAPAGDLHPDGTFVAHMAKGEQLRLDVNAFDRPLAISGAGGRGLSRAVPFDHAVSASIQMALRVFERQLAPLLMQNWIASALRSRSLSLDDAVYHLNDGGKLVAVVGQAHGIAVDPRTALDALRRATWVKRPDVAGHHVPASFACTETDYVLWRWARRNREELLSSGRKPALVRWVKLAEVPLAALDDVYLAVMQWLRRTPLRMEQIAERIRQPIDAVRRSVGALELVGSVRVVANPIELPFGARKALQRPRDSVFHPTAPGMRGEHGRPRVTHAGKASSGS